MEIDEKKRILLEHYNEHVKPTEESHDQLLRENKELRMKIVMLKEESARYRDTASRLRQEKKSLLDRIEMMNEERKKEKVLGYGHSFRKNKHNK